MTSAVVSLGFGDVRQLRNRGGPANCAGTIEDAIAYLCSIPRIKNQEPDIHRRKKRCRPLGGVKAKQECHFSRPSAFWFCLSCLFKASDEVRAARNGDQAPEQKPWGNDKTAPPEPRKHVNSHHNRIAHAVASINPSCRKRSTAESKRVYSMHR